MKKAFTLVELLVVIGILGILIAVLMGTFAGSTESARAAKCQSNMRNLALAVQNVALDNKYSYLPYAGSFTQRTGSRKSGDDDSDEKQAKGWIAWGTDSASGKYISPYTSSENQLQREMSLTNGTIWASLKGNRDCYVCPSHVKYTNDNLKGSGGGIGDPLWSYAMSAYFYWASKSTSFYHDKHGRVYRNFSRSDKFLLFAELPYAKMQTASGDVIQEGANSTGASQENDPVLQYPGCDGSGNEAIGFNHKDGKMIMAHVCYLDGHVDRLMAPRGFSTDDAKELTTWLCHPVDDDGKPFDVMLNTKNQKYEKVQ